MSIAFVQGADAGVRGSTSSSSTATLAATPTVGNLLIAVTATSATGSPVTMTGWTEVTPRNTSFFTNGQGGAFLIQHWYRVVQSGDTTTVATCSGAGAYMWIGVGEFSGMGTPTFDTPVWDEDTSATHTSKAIPTLSPTAGANVLLIATEYLDPNYNPSAPAGWSSAAYRNNPSPPRCTWGLYYQIVASASGTYNGSFTGAGGETAWHVMSVIVTPGAVGGGGSGARSFAIVV